MDLDDLGPLQLLVVGFGPDADYQGLVLDELERLTARGLVRVIDLQFITCDADGTVSTIALSDLDEAEAAEFGAAIGPLLGIGGGRPTASDTTAAPGERAFGLGLGDLAALTADLEPGHAVGLLLFEHTWASRLKAAIRTTGGYPIAQGMLTPEALLMVGAEVRAIAEAEAAIELADAVAGAALLDAVATVAAAEDIRAQAAVDAVRALIVAGLIEDAAASDALDALIAADLIEEAAIAAASDTVATVAHETDAALDALAAADTDG